MSGRNLIRRQFSDRLRRARESKFATATDFAMHIGLEPHTYRAYERAAAEPSFETLIAMCQALGLTPNDLLTLDKHHESKPFPNGKRLQSSH